MSVLCTDMKQKIECFLLAREREEKRSHNLWSFYEHKFIRFWIWIFIDLEIGRTYSRRVLKSLLFFYVNHDFLRWSWYWLFLLKEKSEIRSSAFG